MIGIIYVQVNGKLERVPCSIRRPVRHERSREKARAVKALRSKRKTKWAKQVTILPVQRSGSNISIGLI